MTPDWTVAVDDLLRQAVTRCLLCGSRGAGRLGIWHTRSVALAYVLCHGCRGKDGEARVQALFEARYGRAGDC